MFPAIIFNPTGNGSSGRDVLRLYVAISTSGSTARPYGEQRVFAG